LSVITTVTALINIYFIYLFIKFISQHNKITENHNNKQESTADARVARDSSACVPPSWIFEISKLHH